ncbi:MAG: glutamate 5-kinase, partial [archaeon]|nr:glutamate 5-kinase [archaeon]
MNNNFKRIVVKIGTNALMDNNKPNKKIIKAIAEELSELKKNSSDVILVTSGAIGFGIEKTGGNFPKNVQMQQAMAAIGQSLLMHEYEKAFSKHKQTIAQILLSRLAFTNEKSFENLKNTVEKLFEIKVIPIINENDAIYTEALSEEEVFSDNDGLAALAAIKFNADLLILLTDVDGIFTENPKENNCAEKIKDIEGLLSKGIIEGEKSIYGIGGVKSKIMAAKKALNHNISVAVCRARKGA